MGASSVDVAGTQLKVVLSGQSLVVKEREA